MRLILKKNNYLFWTVWDQTVWAKPSGIPDDVAQTVQNPNSRPKFMDSFKSSRINRLDFILDGLKPSENCEFFVVKPIAGHKP
jgi:hypothetical protein